MAELKMYLSEELDKRFRRLAMIAFGYGRGSLSEAAVEALTKWCEVHEAQDVESVEQVEKQGSSNADPVARAEERPTIEMSADPPAHPSASSSGGA